MLGTLDVYTEHYGLRDRPFSLVPDPAFLFWSPSHARAHAVLEYGVLTRAPITLVTGEVGAGKTTLLHRFLENAPPELTIGLVSNARGVHDELLHWVLLAFGQTPIDASGHVPMFAQFQNFLIEQYATGRRCVLMFDEAQNLPAVSLEELRMLTNINSNRDELLQIVLVGQPELRDTIAQPGMAQFAQRIAATSHLNAMDEGTTRDYIAHRLMVAGAQRQIFASDACDAIARATGGIPRLVNQLCELALVYGMTSGEDLVSGAVVQQVIDDNLFFYAASASAYAPPPAPAPVAPSRVAAPSHPLRPAGMNPAPSPYQGGTQATPTMLHRPYGQVG